MAEPRQALSEAISLYLSEPGDVKHVELEDELLATSLFGDPAAGFREDVSARIREHPAFMRPLNSAPDLVLADICIWFRPLTVICRAWRRGQCRVDGSRPARRHR
jgi:hypothetical protein